MLRDRGSAHRECACELADRRGAGLQPLEDLPAGRVRQCGECRCVSHDLRYPRLTERQVPSPTSCQDYTQACQDYTQARPPSAGTKQERRGKFLGFKNLSGCRRRVAGELSEGIALTRTVATPFTGGCACGAIRYECLALPLRMLNCHCRDCQLAGGSGFSPTLIMARGVVKLTKGQPRILRRLLTAAILRNGSSVPVAARRCLRRLPLRWSTLP